MDRVYNTYWLPDNTWYINFCKTAAAKKNLDHSINWWHDHRWHWYKAYKTTIFSPRTNLTEPVNASFVHRGSVMLQFLRSMSLIFQKEKLLMCSVSGLVDRQIAKISNLRDSVYTTTSKYHKIFFFAHL